MSIRVLNVNDSSSNRYYVSRVLKSAGFEVLEAAAGAEALDIARRERPSVVVLDIMLPDMSGLEVCRMLRADPLTSGMIIIQTSATFVTSEGKVRGLESGADQYLTQPFESVELIAMVRSLLRLRDKEFESREKAAALVEADKRKDEFLAMLAHELRNPLSAISSAAALLETSELAPSAARLNATIQRQTRNLARLIDDLLDVSRITRGKIELRVEAIDFAAMVRRFVESDGSWIARRHKLTLKIADEPLWVNGDGTRLEQIISNLLGNAAKYTQADGAITVSLCSSMSEGQRLVEIKVRDSGVGIDPRHVGSIFDLFYQVDDSLARSQGGLGIGLTMVKRLVELHSGKIAASSDGIGLGAEFIVQLPAAAEVTTSPIERSESPRGGTYSVLLVDDNIDACELLALALERSGHRVQLAHDGQDGLSKALTERYDVALVDIGLPFVDGYSIAEQVRARRGSEQPVLIAVTGYGRESDRQRALDAGFDAHFVKPVEPDRLARALDQVVFDRRPESKRSA